MPGRVPELPSLSELGQYSVGRPISQRQGQRWADDLAFLLGRQLPPIVSTTFDALNSSSTDTTWSYYVAVGLSPGVQVLRIECELYGGDPGEEGTITVNLSDALSGALWLTGQSARLDGSAPIPRPNAQSRRTAPEVGFLDVTACDKSGIGQFSITVDAPLSRLTVCEVPIPTFDPRSSLTEEVSVDPGWPAAGKALVDGGAGSVKGAYRVFHELDRARANVRRHIQVLTAEESAPWWYRTDTAFGNAFVGGAGIFYGTISRQRALRTRRLYTDATPNSYTPVIRYRTTGAGNGEVIFRVTPRGGVLADTTITLPSSASWTTLISGTDVLFPCDGTDQLCDYVVDFRMISGGETVYVDLVALIENEA